ncbi:DUF1203 domain-containing protein [Marinicella meishanensis]|uniref:DUF1203 domain-containing protein n=1 Tax=Marinicella meishanensis TaxID=2873263 RepID=UPI001CBA92B3|nr:DUF1203 domain-containing protein [Marinicella sp. NBU2979]
MITDFQIQALPIDPFLPWFDLNPDELRQRGARWLTAEASPGYPCRVSLTDAQLGEQVLALPYTHHDVTSPYRASGPIFVRQQAVQAQPEINEIPAMLRHRLLSVRAYDASHMMIAATVIEGVELAQTIHRQWHNPAVQYLHLHNAMPGCFNCAVQRVVQT